MQPISSRPPPRIALVQLYVPAECTPTQQFQRASVFIHDAVERGADLVVLPEAALGLCAGSEFPQFSKKCATELANFQKLAKELSVNIIPGSMCEEVQGSDGEEPYYCNTTYYIDRNGAIKLVYRKVNLWGDERKASRKGNVHEVIDTEEFGQNGLLICWDLAFPEAFRALVKKGAKMIVIPTLWKLQDCGPKGLAANPESESIFINSIMSARAFEQNVCVVFCNTGGPVSEGHFGNSQITLPFKGPILKATAEEQVVVGEVDFGTLLEDAEDVWNIRADIDSPDWYSVKD